MITRERLERIANNPQVSEAIRNEIRRILDTPGEFEKLVEFGEKHPLIKDLATFIVKTAPEYTKKILSAQGREELKKATIKALKSIKGEHD